MVVRYSSFRDKKKIGHFSGYLKKMIISVKKTYLMYLQPRKRLKKQPRNNQKGKMVN